MNTKKAALISIGNELLNGQIYDTNSAFITQNLLQIGIPTTRIFTVGDDINAITESIAAAVSKADIVIITGGLGPTDDDLTRHALTRFLNTPLVLYEDALAKIEQFFKQRQKQMPKTNIIQAKLPAGTIPIDNRLGTAPGIFAEYQDKKIFALPGVPAEMKKMFSDFVLPNLAKDSQAAENVIKIKKLHCFGIGESALAEKLGGLMHRDRNPLINCTVSGGVITLHIIASAKTHQQAEQLIAKDENLLKNLLGDLIFGSDDQTLAAAVAEKLAAANKTIAAAESCTGGLIAKLLTDIPGASRYFMCGWVTYSNDAKIQLLGIDPKIIEKHGAVSEQTARAMALAAKQIAKTDFAIAVTGIAGPTGATPGKPVGLVYIAVAGDDFTLVQKHFFSHTRDFVRYRAALTALNIIRLKLHV